jgi:hypothetical protein
MNAGFTTWVWPAEKTHPKLAYQLFYFSTRSCPDTPVPDHHGPRFTTIFVRRAESLGRRLKDFNFSTEACFSWQTWGAYSLVAKAVAAEEKDEWHPGATRPYTHVKYCGGMEVELPTALGIDSSWQIQNNWDDAEAKVVQLRNNKVTLATSLHDLFLRANGGEDFTVQCDLSKVTTAMDGPAPPPLPQRGGGSSDSLVGSPTEVGSGSSPTASPCYPPRPAAKAAASPRPAAGMVEDECGEFVGPPTKVRKVLQA